MSLYAPARRLRARQFLADLGMVVWVVTFVWLGILVHRLVTGLAGPGRSLEQAGTRLGGAAARGGGATDDVPIIGDALSRPFDAIAVAGESLAEAGIAQQEAVATLALLVAVPVAGLPILWLVVRWAPWRIRWVVEASAVSALLVNGAGTALLAHRALARQPVDALLRAEPDPWAAFAEGRHARLAALELDALGLLPEADRR